MWLTGMWNTKMPAGQGKNKGIAEYFCVQACHKIEESSDNYAVL